MIKNQDGKTYAELGFFNAEKVYSFVKVASIADEKVADNLLPSRNNLGKVLSSLMAYVFSVTDEQSRYYNLMKYLFPVEKLEGCIYICDKYRFLSYRKLFKLLGMGDSRVISLDGEPYEVEGIIFSRNNAPIEIVLRDFYGATPDNRIIYLGAPSIAPDNFAAGPNSLLEPNESYCKLDITYVDHLTLMALVKMSISTILKLTLYLSF